ncbi:MAG: hypothetical protein HKN26_03665 [Acidimicrobiales bacterium]|nr:hypothetical protein [Acidimicrobiales bacterium]
MTDLDKWQAVGVYDPDDPNAASRAELLAVFEASGIEPDVFVGREPFGDIARIANESIIRPGPRFDAAEAAARSGLPYEKFDAMRRAAGYPQSDSAFYTDADLAGFAAFSMAGEMFTESELLHFTRVVSSSLARVAEAAISLFQVDVAADMMAAELSEIEVWVKNFEASQMLSEVRAPLDAIFNLHLEQAIQRNDASRTADGSMVRMAIGFVDLVGSTPVMDALPAEELGRLVREFEEQAYDTVTDHGGRVVKLIGDEVMFAAVDPNVACEAALALVEAFQNSVVVPRGGMAYGDLLDRSGDYYGPVVNLASRAGDQAVPGEILVSGELAEAATNFSFESAGRRQLKGIAEPIRLHSLVSA